MKVGSLIRLQINGEWYKAIITAIEGNGVQLWWLDGGSQRPYDWFVREFIEQHQRDKILEVICV